MSLLPPHLLINSTHVYYRYILCMCRVIIVSLITVVTAFFIKKKFETRREKNEDKSDVTSWCSPALLLTNCIMGKSVNLKDSVLVNESSNFFFRHTVQFEQPA